jgi:hypothetical protein
MVDAAHNLLLVTHVLHVAVAVDAVDAVDAAAIQKTTSVHCSLAMLASILP